MKTLIEDYKRRLKTAEKMIEESAKSRDGIEKHQRLQTKASEYRTFIAELEREYKSKLSSYTEVWAIQSYAGSDVDHVFIDKDDAQKEADKMREEFIAYQRKINKRMSDEEFAEYAKKAYLDIKYKVVTLDDAIVAIKDEIRDDYASQEDPSY